MWQKLIQKYKKTTMHTFLVDNVEKANEAYSSNHKLYDAYLCSKLNLAPSNVLYSTQLPASTSIVESSEGQLISNQLIRLFHLAYADHYALRITPDDIWLTIMQQLATHVQENAEQLRHQFVKHADKKQIKIIRDDFALDKFNDWPSAIQDLSNALKDYIPEHVHNLVVNNFSTTTFDSKVASQIVLMDAMGSYFNYVIETLCGIPLITVLGTASDWQSMIDRLPLLGKFGMQKYVDAVIPILQEFLLAAQGKPNVSFWQDVYKLQYQSGGAAITGWIVNLFYYIRDYKEQLVINPMYREDMDQSTIEYLELEGFSTNSFWTIWSQCPVEWQFMGTSIPLNFIAGHTGVFQDDNTLELTLQIGYLVAKK